ncbi:hypothetical protein [Campylobacter showae]|uniref:hypothetical protein n=1 Tax=Campylobacter showae TaxID=204 RepID=UPI000F0907A1|nr:hypothetical protein [Campylobacter showae]
MNTKFQAEMKELDEKFAAISEDEKGGTIGIGLSGGRLWYFGRLWFLCFMLKTSWGIMYILMPLVEIRTHIH